METPIEELLDKNETSLPLLQLEEPTKLSTKQFLLKLFGVIFVPLIGNFLWVMIPFHGFHEDSCANSPYFGTQFIWVFVYAFVTVQTAFALLIPLGRQSYKIQFVFNAVLSALLALAMISGGESKNRFLAGEWFPVIVVMFGSCVPVIIFQVALDWAKGKPWEHECTMVTWCILVVAFVLAFFCWSELVTFAMTAKKSWMSPVFLPVAFVLGLSTIRRLAQFVVVGMSKAISRHQSIVIRRGISDHPLTKIDTDFPAVAFDFIQQYFFFVFYRQLFFDARDFVSMGILQLHGMAIDLVIAFACLRFSVVQFSPSHVTLQIERKYLADKGNQLVCRQIARTASLISVLCFNPFLRFGYNKCFYSTSSTVAFDNLMLNFVVMGTWEAIFVVVLFRALRAYLGLDLILCAKNLLAKPYVVHLFVPLASHFISDVYFGLHTF